MLSGGQWLVSVQRFQSLQKYLSSLLSPFLALPSPASISDSVIGPGGAPQTWFPASLLGGGLQEEGKGTLQ